MDTKQIEELKLLIHQGNFFNASLLIEKMDYEALGYLLLDLAYEKREISIYSFVCSLIILNEKAELHSIASDLLTFPYNYFEGAYSAALYHARKALELDPNNVENKQYLIFFHNIPEQLISVEEAIQIAKEVLAVDPNSIVSKSLLERYKER